MVRKLRSFLAPDYWLVPKKEVTWTISPSPGPHKKFECIPLAILIRNILNLAENLKEAKRIIRGGNIIVDGRIRKDYAFPVGLFDIISIPKIEKYYRVVPFEKGLRVIEIDKSEANKKICKVVNKTVVKKGKIQLNLHDGKNLLFDNSVKTNYSLLLELPSLKVLDVLPFEVGNLAITKKGFIGRISEYDKKNRTVVLKDENNNTYSTTIEYVYVIGREYPLIKLRWI